MGIKYYFIIKVLFCTNIIHLQKNNIPTIPRINTNMKSIIIVKSKKKLKKKNKNNGAYRIKCNGCTATYMYIG